MLNKLITTSENRFFGSVARSLVFEAVSWEFKSWQKRNFLTQKCIYLCVTKSRQRSKIEKRVKKWGVLFVLLQWLSWLFCHSHSEDFARRKLIIVNSYMTFTSWKWKSMPPSTRSLDFLLNLPWHGRSLYRPKICFNALLI